MKAQSHRILKDLEELSVWTEPHFRLWENQNLFITGGTGFFGKWLLEVLRFYREKRKIQFGNIYVLSRNPEAFIRSYPNLQQFDFIEGDIRDFSFPQKRIHGFIHGATAASVQLNLEAPKEMYDTIVEGTRRALLCARESRSSRFLMISSGAVYGKKTLVDGLSKEEDYIIGGGGDTLGDAYSDGKREAERLVAAAESGNFSAVIARCFAFVGPHLPLDTHFAAGNFISDCLAGREIVIKGDGQPRRTYLYPSDLIGWLFVVFALGKKNQPYNVGSDRMVSILETARLVQQGGLSLGLPEVSIRVLQKSEDGKPVPIYAPSIERAQNELGLQVRVDLRNAVRRTIEYHLEGQTLGY